MKVKVAQLCLTLCNPMDYIVHGILQARILEWVAFPFSRGSFQPRDQPQVSCIVGGLFTSWATREASINKNQVLKEYWIHFSIFWTMLSNHIASFLKSILPLEKFLGVEILSRLEAMLMFTADAVVTTYYQNQHLS